MRQGSQSFKLDVNVWNVWHKKREIERNSKHMKDINKKLGAWDVLKKLVWQGKKTFRRASKV